MPKRTAQELREQAAKLLEQAKRLENERAIKISNLVLKYEAAGFEGFDLKSFKNQIAKL